MKIKLICAKVNQFTGEQYPNKKEIASFADRLLNDYCRKFGRTLETINYDDFVCKYIGVDIQYQRLSLNKSILGVTIQRDGVLETYNEDGTIDYEYLSLYQFATVMNLPMTPSLDKPSKIIFGSNGQVSFTFPPLVTDRSLTIALPIGDYIIEVKNMNDDLTTNTARLKLDNTALGMMYDSSIKDLTAKGVYYVKMSIADTSSHTLTMHIEGNTYDAAIQL